MSPSPTSACPVASDYMLVATDTPTVQTDTGAIGITAIQGGKGGIVRTSTLVKLQVVNGYIQSQPGTVVSWPGVWIYKAGSLHSIPDYATFAALQYGLDQVAVVSPLCLAFYGTGGNLPSVNDAGGIQGVFATLNGFGAVTPAPSGGPVQSPVPANGIGGVLTGAEGALARYEKPVLIGLAILGFFYVGGPRLIRRALGRGY